MININMFGGWWQNHPGNPANTPKEPDKTEPIPTRCEFCTKPICEGDTYYIGYDVRMIFAMCCTEHKCKQWLEYKVRRTKPWTL